MSRNDAPPLLAFLLLALFSCACLAEGIETLQEGGYSDQGSYQGRSLLLLQDSGAYLGGTLADWRSDPQNTTRITGVFIGYKSNGPIALDLAIGGYSELDPRRDHPLEELLPRDLGSLGRIAIDLTMNRNLRLGLGGLYLRGQQTESGHSRPGGDRLIGQARLDYRFF